MHEDVINGSPHAQNHFLHPLPRRHTFSGSEHCTWSIKAALSTHTSGLATEGYHRIVDFTRTYEGPGRSFRIAHNTEVRQGIL